MKFADNGMKRMPYKLFWNRPRWVLIVSFWTSYLKLNLSQTYGAYYLGTIQSYEKYVMASSLLFLKCNFFFAIFPCSSKNDQDYLYVFFHNEQVLSTIILSKIEISERRLQENSRSFARMYQNGSTTTTTVLLKMRVK